MNNTKINPLYNTSKEFRHLVSDLDHNVNNFLNQIKSILDVCDEQTLITVVDLIDKFTKYLIDYETENSSDA